ncbi:MAG: hypothetical protein RLZZ59_450 [Pseudomonadota bacterium]|jgi:multisubunit Na+/H+ antiporter MnhF subunit
MLEFSTFIILGLFLFAIIALAIQRDFYERFLCFSLVTNIAVVFIVAMGSYRYNSSFLDIAIIYLSLSYIVNMVILKFASSQS